MESKARVDSMEAMMASMAELAVLADRSKGGTYAAGSNPLRDQSDACLDGLKVTARLEAMLSARKVRFAAGFAATSAALAAPAQSPGQHTAQEMCVVAEVACALTVSERTASALLAESVDLTTTLPLTMEALEQGSLSWQHARAMVDETANLNPAGAAALESHFLAPDAPDAANWSPPGELVPSRFRAKARSWRERHHPESIEKRHARSFADRRLEYAPDRDGMAWLSAYLPADQAAGIWNRTTSIARALEGPAEDRTLTQRRADVAATLLLGGIGGTAAADRTCHETTTGATDEQDDDRADGSAGRAADTTAGISGEHATAGHIAGSVLADAVSIPGGVHPGSLASGLHPGSLANDVQSGDVARRVPTPGAQVLLTVPVFSLMGLTDEPADLDGYGPIPASMARKLVADGASSFRRVLTDPRDGTPLEIGRKSYPIPTAMRQWLRMRDGKCTFPGCNNQSLDNDADHILAWADGGTTGISNLESLCRKHHRLKHTTSWTPTGASKDKPPGWTSPTGRHYPSEHHDWEPPQWPPQILEELKRRETGAATSECGPPGDWSLENNQFDDRTSGQPDDRQLNQPLPGNHTPQETCPADQPPEETGTDEYPAEGTVPGGHHRRVDTPPDDRALDGAWLRQALDELDPAPYLSIADFVWRAERPLANSASS